MQSDSVLNAIWQTRPARVADIPTIQEIVHLAWPVAFGQIVSPEFLAHELNRVYNDDALKTLMADGEHFILGESDGTAIGFASWRLGDSATERLGKLEKLYLKPNLKGQGHGKALVLQVIQAASQAGCQSLSLNVNRENPAVQFYERMGFTILKSEDIEVGPGFFRNDYVMIRPLL